jgi:hypothetical protein
VRIRFGCGLDSSIYSILYFWSGSLWAVKNMQSILNSALKRAVQRERERESYRNTLRSERQKVTKAKGNNPVLSTRTRNKYLIEYFAVRYMYRVVFFVWLYIFFYPSFPVRIWYNEIPPLASRRCNEPTHPLPNSLRLSVLSRLVILLITKFVLKSLFAPRIKPVAPQSVNLTAPPPPSSKHLQRCRIANCYTLAYGTFHAFTLGKYW